PHRPGHARALPHRSPRGGGRVGLRGRQEVRPVNAVHSSAMRTTLDLAKLAIVYPRQSTPGQVQDNVESTREQYRLREPATARGFADARILIVDQDLGVT